MSDNYEWVGYAGEQLTSLQQKIMNEHANRIMEELTQSIFNCSATSTAIEPDFENMKRAKAKVVEPNTPLRLELSEPER